MFAFFAQAWYERVFRLTLAQGVFEIILKKVVRKHWKAIVKQNSAIVEGVTVFCAENVLIG